MRIYHDEEWGVPVFDDRELFERLILEGFQAGLSWRTILHKRDNFRAAFDGFDPEMIARYGEDKVQELMQNAGIVRNQRKIRAAIQNAQAFLALAERTNSVSEWLWAFVDGEPLLPDKPLTPGDLPVTTPEAKAMSKQLRKEGFSFVGPTICYAFMQSVGMVNDHVMGCFKYVGPLP
jgi:DNA-3-methyladenine glycosylase I